jgi:hypothetical protein
MSLFVLIVTCFYNTAGGDSYQTSVEDLISRSRSDEDQPKTQEDRCVHVCQENGGCSVEV